MDIRKAARFFDRQHFDVYDFGSASWTLRAFRGQLHVSDDFVAIWNRPTRNRMASCQPTVFPSSPVVRVSGLPEVYMVKTPHTDSNFDSSYRTTFGLHMTKGVAEISRRYPTGPEEDPGWAVSFRGATTFADTELRSVNESQDREIVNYGNYFAFFPRGTDLRVHDTFTLLGDEFYVLETYIDSGLQAARVTSNPDERVNFVYVALGEPVYDFNTSEFVTPETRYNVTGKITKIKLEDLENTELQNEVIEVMVLKSWIGVVPKPNDVIEYGGEEYKITSVSQNAIETEWYIKAIA